MSGQPKPASDHTAAANRAAVVDFDDPGDFERASRGLLAQIESGRVAVGDWPVWDVAPHDFQRGDDAAQAPYSVHPSLWRQARLNAIHGLFEVVPGVYQARGYDLSNITFLAGDEGWLVIDPLTTAETAAACLELANSTLGERPVTSVIYTHSHVDHYGGVEGVTNKEAVDAGEVRIIAPEGFLHEVVSENVIAGPAMGRRALYQFGPLIPPGEFGHIDNGLGKGLPLGTMGLIAPTEEISATGTELMIDGIRVVFQHTPDTEAPAEMNFHFPDHRLLCMAENCSHTMHNLYTLRGAQIRDSLSWSKYIGEAIELFGDQTDTVFASHHWPRFGRDDAVGFLELQRDVYRWLHDQTMRRANRGETALEIAEELELPECFSHESHVQGYYGTVSHNVKAVYQRYLGWFDANPANLEPHPPVEAGRRYVELAGGADALMTHARRAYEAGDHRWVAEVVNHLVFADPAHTEARHLQADALEQLGYASESGIWRNFYLTGAHELRNGTTPALGAGRQTASSAMTTEQLIDTMGVRFVPERCEPDRIRVNLTITDPAGDAESVELHVLGVANAAVHHIPDRHDPEPDASLSITRAAFADLISGNATLADTEDTGAVIEDDRSLLRLLTEALEQAPGTFGIIEP